MKPKTITIEGDEMLNRIVAPLGNSGKIGVPKSWVGCSVVVVKLPNPAKVWTRSKAIEQVGDKIIDLFNAKEDMSSFKLAHEFELSNDDVMKIWDELIKEGTMELTDEGLCRQHLLKLMREPEKGSD